MAPEHEAGDCRNVEAPAHHVTEGGLALRKSAVGLVPKDGDDVVADTLDERDRRVVGCGRPLSPDRADEGSDQGDG